VATLNPPVKAPAVLRQLPLERAGRAPALATSLRAGVLVGAFLALANPTGERVQRQAAVLQCYDRCKKAKKGSKNRNTIKLGKIKVPEISFYVKADFSEWTKSQHSSSTTYKEDAVAVGSG